MAGGTPLVLGGHVRRLPRHDVTVIRSWLGPLLTSALLVGCTAASSSTSELTPSSPSPSPTPPVVASPRLDYYAPLIRGLARQVSFDDVRRLFIRTDICETAADLPFGREKEVCRDAFTPDEQAALATRLGSFADRIRFVDGDDAFPATRRGVLVWLGPMDRRHGDLLIGGGAWTGGSAQGGTYVLERREDRWVFGGWGGGSAWIT